MAAVCSLGYGWALETSVIDWKQSNLRCHSMDPIAALLVLMHAYLSAYAHRLIMLTYVATCLCTFGFAYGFLCLLIYACLCMFVWLLMVYDVREGKFCWNYAVWRKGKGYWEFYYY
jgi:hypothetical protein